jgi:Arylsulfotransferase (ASST)
MVVRRALAAIAIASLVPTAAAGCSSNAAGPPSLIKLSLSASAGAASKLVPPFASDVHDYYVRCAAGTNTFTVSMTASAGSSSALIKPTPPSPSSPSQTLSVSAKEGDAIVATATSGTSTTEYWVRCLPHDFPELTLTAHPDAGTPSAGYYLVGNAVVSAGEAGYAMVLDGNGVPVWYHPLAAGLAVTDVDNIVSGAISFIPTSFTANEPFELHKLSPLSTTTLAPDKFTADEHELRVLPNGHYFVLSYVLTPGVDLTHLGIPKAFDGGLLELGPNSTIQDCAVVEFDETGKVYAHWLASDHFDPVVDSTYPQTGFGPGSKLPDGGSAYDVYHCNSIDVDPANGNLLVSARGMDSVFYVEWPGGKVLWKMGGAKASIDNATYVTVTDPFFRQHDARLVRGWSPTCNGGTGQVSVFDDETGKPGPARAAIYDVVVGGGDAKCADAGSATPGNATLSWQVKGTTVSGGAGSVRISPDNSRIIGWGIGVPVFTEVDVNGHALLELEFTAGDVSYRAVKVPLTAFDLEVLRDTAGK